LYKDDDNNNDDNDTSEIERCANEGKPTKKKKLSKPLMTLQARKLQEHQIRIAERIVAEVEAVAIVLH